MKINSSIEITAITGRLMEDLPLSYWPWSDSEEEDQFTFVDSSSWGLLEVEFHE